MKKLLLISLLFASCATPYQITETISKDSTGKEIKTIVKKFDNTTVVTPQASVNIIGSPYFYGYGSYYSMPYYFGPRVIVPIRNTPHIRGGRH